MIEVSILIPVRANDGSTFTNEDHEVFETELMSLFGGYTLLDASVSGGWTDASVVYKDESRLYIVFLASLVDGSKVGVAVAFAKNHYGQLAITIRYLGLAEIL